MKFIRRIRGGYLAMLAAGIAIGFIAVGTASAAGARPAPVQHYTLAASAFAPDSLHGATADYFNEWDPSTLFNNQTGRCFNAGTALPNGATLRSVTFYFTNGKTDSFYGELNRQNLALHLYKTLAFFRSTPTGTKPVYTHKTLTINANKRVDTGTYAYSLGVCPGGDSTFTGVMINYTG